MQQENINTNIAAAKQKQNLVWLLPDTVGYESK